MSSFRSLSALLLACTAFFAQASSPQELTTAWPVNAGPLNPHLYTPNQMFAQSMVYEPLVKYQADGTVKPWLAKSWTSSEDGKTWVFTLRGDVTFSNGEPFNAQAAVENSAKARNDDYNAAEKIIMVKAPIAPIYQYTNGRLIKPWLKGYPITNPEDVAYSRTMYIVKH